MTVTIVPLHTGEDDSNDDTQMIPTAIFRQEWWLDAVAPGSWHQVMVRQGDALVGQLPFATCRKFGMTCLMNPPLTPSLGPWLRAASGKHPSYQQEQDILSLLIQSLPAFESFDVTFSPDSSSWQPFFRAGFESENQVTFRIDNIQSAIERIDSLPDDQRLAFERAGSQLKIRADFGIEAFALVFERLANRVPEGYDRDAFRRLDSACRARDAGAGFVALDVTGMVRAAQYLVWDDDTTYLLLSATGPVEEIAATRWLTWHSIQFAAQRSASFDFLTSMNQDSDMLIRDFGVQAVTHLHVWRNSRRLQALERLAGVLRAEKPSRPGRTYVGLR